MKYSHFRLHAQFDVEAEIVGISKPEVGVITPTFSRYRKYIPMTTRCVQNLKWLAAFVFEISIFGHRG